MDEKIYKAVKKIRYEMKQGPNTKGIYDHLIRVDVFIDASLVALEEGTKNMKDNIINKKLKVRILSITIRKKFLKYKLQRPTYYPLRMYL